MLNKKVITPATSDKSALESLTAAVRATLPVPGNPMAHPEGHAEAHAALDAHIAEVEAEFGATSPQAEEARRLANIARYVK